MNKSDLIKAIAEDAGITQTTASAALDATTSIISQELADGGEVQLIGFGTFKTAERSARTGRNPKTGEAIEIAAKTVPTFTAGKTLKDRVNHH
ncbi:HU family DNA-binding protein [Psychrobacter sp. APC 3279]|uniref:HU family DNA-binding protein n=1 Tax=Psychrobacter sp. APC 3279 TaxID=3035189 RepID=UPI0025B5001E|nr:HU family DNA-binding protein [Psychrobacter sp. APC 3279]MDN3441072.1 HU family DNA-binding protein [Psychrobacter sp. APC 3279]